MKTEVQKIKELKALKSYLNYIYNEGLTKKEAAAKVGMSRYGLEQMKKRLLPNDFESTLKEKGFDPHTWDHGWLKIEGSSIHIKNQDKELTHEEIRKRIMEDMHKHSPKYPKIKRSKVSDGHLLVISLCDLHVGKLAVDADSGETYNIKEAVKRGKEGVQGLIDKASGFNIDKILLMIGHDILHTDNLDRKTTAGTRQDTDGSWHQAYLAARNLYVDVIEMLAPIAPMKVVHTTSNHDYISGSLLADSIACWFRNTDIEFDVSVRPWKFFKYGESMIGMNHGDGMKGEKYAGLMAELEKKMWSETTYRYWILGHFHHKIAKEEIGVTVEYVRSPSAADAWHTIHGYISKPAIEGFIHSKDTGQIARLTHYV